MAHRSPGNLVPVVVVEPGRDPFLLGQPGKLVVVEMPGNAAVLTAVAVELLGRLFRVLLAHHASMGSAARLPREVNLNPGG